MSYVLILVLVLFALYAGRRFLFRGIFKLLQLNPKLKAEMDLQKRSYESEETVIEEASWFGTTGLPDEDERELPKYLRREFGELLLEEDSLKASDLRYIGVFEEPDARVHYWLMGRSRAACRGRGSDQ